MIGCPDRGRDAHLVFSRDISNDARPDGTSPINQSDSHYDSGGPGEEISRRESRRRR